MDFPGRGGELSGRSLSTTARLELSNALELRLELSNDKILPCLFTKFTAFWSSNEFICGGATRFVGGGSTRLTDGDSTRLICEVSIRLIDGESMRLIAGESTRLIGNPLILSDSIISSQRLLRSIPFTQKSP